MSSQWMRTWRADPRAALLADRHYSRQAPGTDQFSPPGRVLVLVTPDYDALWVTSWPYAQFVNRQQYPDAWVCTLFRREPTCPHLASDLIRSAVAATRWIWPDVPAAGMVTMVDAGKVRHKRDPGRCFRRAGFVPAGETQEAGLLVMRLAPEDMPAAAPPDGLQPLLFSSSA